MKWLDFFANNYINIILIVSSLSAIFFSHASKSKKSILNYIFLTCSFIFCVFHSLYIHDPIAKYLLGLCMSMEAIMLVFVYYVISLVKKEHGIFLIPFLISLIAYIFVSEYTYIPYATCMVYFIMLLIRALRNLHDKEGSKSIYQSVCCLASIIAIVIDFFVTRQNSLSVFSNYSLINTTLLICSLALFVRYFVFEENKKKLAQEKLVQDQKTSIAISQIQPHFLYNSLATIGYLCKKDPQTASLAIDKFSDYLRANLNSMAQSNNVPFNDELKHVQTYLWLEKLRFEDRLELEYDIQVSDFLVPSLSIQPLVENAVKHGICNKIDGGKLTIRTIAYSECIKIVIEDNGVGFDIKSEHKADGRTHVGIENVKSRIASMANGTLEIQSTVGKGTISTITIPRR